MSAVISRKVITGQQLDEALKQCGFDELALALSASSAANGMARQDGLWLEWLHEPVYELGLEGSYWLSVSLYANTPFALREAAQLDATILKNPDARRMNSFSNGICDTAVYEFYGADAGVTKHRGAVTGAVMLKDGKPWRLMVDVPTGYPQLREVAQRAAESMADAAGAADLKGDITRWAASSEPHWLARLD